MRVQINLLNDFYSLLFIRFLTRLVADVLGVMPRLNSMEVPLDQYVSGPRIFHELVVVVHVVNAREDLFKVAQSELLLFKIQNNSKVFVGEFIEVIDIFVHNLDQLAQVAIGILLN